jgi:hypothetical protein
MRRSATPLAVLAVLAILAVGCGDAVAGTPASAPGDDAGTDARVAPEVGLEPHVLAERFEGLPLDEAQDAADALGVPFRVARIDEEEFMLTMDLLPGRVTVEADTVDGVVTITSVVVESE